MPQWIYTAGSLLIMFLLIGVNAFFVAAELSVVRVRRTRLEELSGKGIDAAKASILCINNLDASLTTTQVGITIASIGVGWLGESAFADILAVYLSSSLSSTQLHFLSTVVAFSVVTLLHVVLGEMVPKNLAITCSETIVLLVAKPLWFCRQVLYPLIWVFTHIAGYLMRLFGLHSIKDPPLSEDELRMILKDSHEEGVINAAEARIIHHSFEFADKTAAEIMIPAASVVFVSLERPVEENIELIVSSQHARFPVCQGELDAIIGIVHMKDVWPLLMKERSNESFVEALRPVTWLEVDTPRDQALNTLQREKIHMACVRDLKNIVLGIVTIEEILESLLGDIREGRR